MSQAAMMSTGINHSNPGISFHPALSIGVTENMGLTGLRHGRSLHDDGIIWYLLSIFVDLSILGRPVYPCFAPPPGDS
jgi:hypothetical protein